MPHLLDFLSLERDLDLSRWRLCLLSLSRSLLLDLDLVRERRFLCLLLCRRDLLRDRLRLRLPILKDKIPQISDYFGTNLQPNDNPSWSRSLWNQYGGITDVTAFGNSRFLPTTHSEWVTGETFWRPFLLVLYIHNDKLYRIIIWLSEVD